MTEPKTKRMVVVSDFHSGHEYGLTPPDWWLRDDTNNPHVTKCGKFQRELWAFYTEAINDLKPIDFLIVNGDAIEGKGLDSGSMELLTADRHEQVKMAKEAIDLAEAKKIRILFGTRRHTGKEEDFESVLAGIVKCNDIEVSGHGFFNVNGCNVDVKHKVSGSTIPHGRMTAIARARLWNVIWNSEHERQPKADIIIRSHVHYFNYCGSGSWIAMTTPALCYNSSFGIRECEGLVDVGIVSFDIDSEGKYTWKINMADYSALRVSAESL